MPTFDRETYWYKRYMEARYDTVKRGMEVSRLQRRVHRQKRANRKLREALDRKAPDGVLSGREPDRTQGTGEDAETQQSGSQTPSGGRWCPRCGSANCCNRNPEIRGPDMTTRAAYQNGVTDALRFAKKLMTSPTDVSIVTALNRKLFDVGSFEGPLAPWGGGDAFDRGEG